MQTFRNRCTESGSICKQVEIFENNYKMLEIFANICKGNVARIYPNHRIMPTGGCLRHERGFHFCGCLSSKKKKLYVARPSGRIMPMVWLCAPRKGGFPFCGCVSSKKKRVLFIQLCKLNGCLRHERGFSILSVLSSTFFFARLDHPIMPTTGCQRQGCVREKAFTLQRGPFFSTIFF